MRALYLDRFEDRLMYEPNSGCWLWTAATTGTGYGQLRVDGRTSLVHRLAYEHFVGPVPDGLHVCHRCDNPPCCNPAHLFLGTPKDNAQDREAKGRNRPQAAWAASQAEKLGRTHCVHGHDRAAHAYWNGRKHICRACRNQWYHDHKAAA